MLQRLSKIAVKIVQQRLDAAEQMRLEWWTRSHAPKCVGELTTSEGSVSAHVSFDTPNRKDLCTVLARVRTRVTQGG